MMRSLALVLAALLPGAAAFAQVSVEVVMDQEYYLAHERCIAEVRITNFSGRPLPFSAEADWLDLAVESSDGYLVPKLAEIPAEEPFSVPSSARGKRRVDLAPCFDVHRPGRYQITAMVRLPGLSQEISSRPAFFHISNGVELWGQTFGVPAESPGKPVEVRRYALLQTNDRKRLALYVRITDESELRVHRVFALGALLSFGRPDAQVDRTGRLHVLFQTGARQFGYFIIRHDGEMLVRQMYQISAGHPRLRLMEGGEITVMGGFRVKSSYDLPTPPPDEELLTPTPEESAALPTTRAPGSETPPAPLGELKPAPPPPRPGE
jgi:hypothetical protein